MDAMMPTMILAGLAFGGFAAALMAMLRMWQGWLDLKKAELARTATPRGEERGEIAELRARVKQLEAIAACVDL
jgi:hypothetical protein